MLDFLRRLFAGSASSAPHAPSVHDPRHYEVEVTRSSAEPTKFVFSTPDADEVIAKLAQLDADPALVFIAWLSPGLDHGNFWLWRHGGRAHVRLDEHREHYASPAVPEVTDRCSFFDEDSGPFSVRGAYTVDAATGVAAMHHWLRTGEMTPTLVWS